MFQIAYFRFALLTGFFNRLFFFLYFFFNGKLQTVGVITVITNV